MLRDAAVQHTEIIGRFKTNLALGFFPYEAEGGFYFAFLDDMNDIPRTPFQGGENFTCLTRYFIRLAVPDGAQPGKSEKIR